MKTTFRSLCATIRRVQVPLSLALALVAGAPLARAQDGKAIVEALVREGVLTSAAAERILKEAAKAPAPVVVTHNAKATTKLALGGRYQFQFDGLSTDVAGPADPASANHFFVRRAYLVLKAELGKDKLVDVAYDLAATSFDAAYFQWKRSDTLAFDIGLRKVNFAFEERTSSGTLKAIERSSATRYFVEDNNGRRLGAGSYRIGLFAEGNQGSFFWSLALTNPERVSTAASMGSAATNRLGSYAGGGVKGKFEGGSYVFGANLGFLPDQGGRTTGTGNDLRVGSVNCDITAGKFNVITEYLTSRNDQGAASGRDAASWGLYLQPSYKFDQHWEGVARYSYVDSDGRGVNLSDGIRSAPSGGTMDKLSEYYLGFTYYVFGNDLKFQAGYVYGQARDTVTGAPAKANASGIRTQMQVMF